MELTINDYPNFLKSIQLTSTGIEELIAGFSLVFDSYKNEEVEWRMKLPMFVHSFYEFITTHGTVPSQEELWELYSSIDEIQSKTSDVDIERGIKSRLYRSYPSLVRDIHFALYLQENSKNGADVIYNIALDVKLGVDIIVKYDETLFAVNLFTPTQRARKARAKKEGRHTTIDNVVQIELPVEFKTERKVGDFFLYGEKELSQLRNIFKKRIQDL